MNVRFIAASMVAARSKQPAVEVTLGPTTVQMDVAKAREVCAILAGAIEAAVSDALTVRFLTEKCGLSDAAAGAALMDLREMRQGSRDTVYPS